MSISFHESHRHLGFRRVNELVVFRTGVDEPEKLGAIDVDRSEFVAEWQAKLRPDELVQIAQQMKDPKRDA